MLKKLEKLIKSSAKTAEEKEELWKIVDEIIHHRVIGCALDNLPREHHEEFLKKLAAKPQNTELLDYLQQKTNSKISNKIKLEIETIENEILNEIK